MVQRLFEAMQFVAELGGLGFGVVVEAIDLLVNRVFLLVEKVLLFRECFPG